MRPRKIHVKRDRDATDSSASSSSLPNFMLLDGVPYAKRVATKRACEDPPLPPECEAHDVQPLVEKRTTREDDADDPSLGPRQRLRVDSVRGDVVYVSVNNNNNNNTASSTQQQSEGDDEDGFDEYEMVSTSASYWDPRGWGQTADITGSDIAVVDLEWGGHVQTWGRDVDDFNDDGARDPDEYDSNEEGIDYPEGPDGYGDSGDERDRRGRRRGGGGDDEFMDGDCDDNDDYDYPTYQNKGGVGGSNRRNFARCNDYDVFI